MPGSFPNNVDSVGKQDCRACRSANHNRTSPACQPTNHLIVDSRWIPQYPSRRTARILAASDYCSFIDVPSVHDGRCSPEIPNRPESPPFTPRASSERPVNQRFPPRNRNVLDSKRTCIAAGAHPTPPTRINQAPLSRSTRLHIAGGQFDQTPITSCRHFARIARSPG